MTPPTAPEWQPQPVGIFPFPASHLLLPQVEGKQGSDVECKQALESLMEGDLQIPLPESWKFFQLAAEGDVEGARRLVQSSACEGTDNARIAAYNQFVLAPDRNRYEPLKTEFQGALAELLDVAAFAVGLMDSVPDTFSLEGELGALAWSTAAAAELERGDERGALRKLKQAVSLARDTSPIQAALILAQISDVGSSSGEMAPAIVIQGYQEAIRLAANCKLPRLVAELHMRLGMAYHHAADGRREMLLQAVASYQAALQTGVTETSEPDLFGQLQNNLGMAYMAMPTVEASHQLRTGIAIQSFRHALKVYDIQRQPDRWACVSMNLANALQYAPTSHPEENLIQAVEIYEQVLQVRTRAKDPVAYALVQMNQANALAHLGMFRPALEKLAEAHKLFHWYDEIEHAKAARELVEQINQHRDQMRKQGLTEETIF